MNTELIKTYQKGIDWTKLLDEAIHKAANYSDVDKIRRIPLFKRLNELAVESPSPSMTDIFASLEAAEELLSKNTPLVEAVLREEFSGIVKTWDLYDDLFNAGILGLHASLAFYNPEKCLDEHASPYIRQSAKNAYQTLLQRKEMSCAVI